MKYFSKFILLFLFCYVNAYSQERGLQPETPSFALKTNVLYDATATFNLGFEQKLNQKWTLDVSANYNPWTFSNNKKWKHVLVQPEARYWLCESFNGTFLGVHAHWGQFNVGGLGINDNMKDHRYQGWLLGAGVSIGHQWILTNRLSLEASIGVGYAYMDFEKFECGNCGEKLGDKTRHYVGPTKAALSLIYVIK